MQIANLINISLENPLKTWWKARKYFKFPKVRFFVYNICFKQPLFKLESFDLLWKDKFDEPRHEISPYIRIIIFRRFELFIQFGMDYKDEFGVLQNGDMEYWEYILTWLYYQKNLINYSTWLTESRLYKTFDHEKNKVIPIKYAIPVVINSLNRKGIKQLKKELNEKGRNS